LATPLRTLAWSPPSPRTNERGGERGTSERPSEGRARETSEGQARTSRTGRREDVGGAVQVEAARSSLPTPSMAAPSDNCSHCGKHGSALKRCSRCRQAAYCGAECQKAGWKLHKTTCAPQLPLNDVLNKVKTASVTQDWREVLKWAGRMEELLEGHADAGCDQSHILHAFSRAHMIGRNETGLAKHALEVVKIETRRAELLGKIERFRDQGEALCTCATHLLLVSKKHEAAGYYKRAREIGEAHGFFSVESLACQGLGKLALKDQRREEGVELLRNALAAAKLNEEDDFHYELHALRDLIEGFFATGEIDEVAQVAYFF
jgi:hypothetical protein